MSDAASPFERDIDDQPSALRAFAHSDTLTSLSLPDLSSFDRVILTGMGASHFGAIPTWRSLVARGHPTWWLSTSELLDSPGLLTGESLLWITSQSGRSGEIVALLRALEDRRPKCTLGVTNDLASPLAEMSDAVVDLHSGVEATVSSKSYLNTLAAHYMLVEKLTGGDEQEALKTVLEATDELSEWLAPTDTIRAIAANAVEAASSRIALVGGGNQAASALLGALIIKEAAKLGAEGFVGGAFRHGPLELAGSGLTAVLYVGRDGNPSLQQLGSELLESGSMTVEIGATGRDHIVTESSSDLSQMILETKFTQCLSVELARAQGLVPGEFRFGKKITSSL
jgi:glucosamine--fructose-6-phosphate aminotransferase (isomerizing)